MCLRRQRLRRSKSAKRLLTCWGSNSISGRRVRSLLPIEGVAATRLVTIFCLTRGLRPGLNATPPLRGWFDRDSSVLLRLATQQPKRLSPERTHMFRFSQDVAFHRSVKLRAGGSGREVELHIEGIQAEEIAMRLARRRTRPVVANLSEVVAALPRAILQLLALRNVLAKGMRVSGKVPKYPVHPGSHGSIGVIHDQSVAGSLCRRAAPIQCGRHIRAFTGEFLGNFGARGEC